LWPVDAPVVQQLIVKNVNSGEMKTYSTDYYHYHSVDIGADDNVYAIASAPDRPDAVICISLADGQVV
jgi:hypothetical protein